MVSDNATLLERLVKVTFNDHGGFLKVTWSCATGVYSRPCGLSPLGFAWRVRDVFRPRPEPSHAPIGLQRGIHAAYTAAISAKKRLSSSNILEA